MKKVLLAPFRVTPDQNRWVLKKAKDTGESVSSILRGLIQAKLETK